MHTIKQDFPIFGTHPDLVYLDSTATSQKPALVIDGVAEYLRSSYANIHRGSYEISEISQKLYEDSKKITAKHIGAENWREIIYTANSTYALNILSQSIWRTGLLQKGDKVLVSMVEHHANIVPWLILKEDYGVEVEFVEIHDNFSLNLDDLRSKLDATVKIVSLTHVSNTTGQIFELEKVGEMLDEVYGSHTKPLFIVDGSQSVPHFQVDVKGIGCDALFFTGHKIFADSGIGVLWAKESLLKQLKPVFSGGGAIGHVSCQEFSHSPTLPDAFEPGTPNLSGAVSLLKAFEYIESIGGYNKLEEIEHELVVYVLEKFDALTLTLSQRERGRAANDTHTALRSSKGQVEEGTQGLSGSGSKAEEEAVASLSGKEREFKGEFGNGGGCVQKGQLHLIGGSNPKTRVGVFTFCVEGIHSFDISDSLAQHNICIRAGQHCAEPFMTSQGLSHTCRMSLHIYNTREDIDRFFEALQEAINELG